MEHLSKLITFLGVDLEVEYTLEDTQSRRSITSLKVYAGDINITELLSEQVLTDIEDHILD